MRFKLLLVAILSVSLVGAGAPALASGSSSAGSSKIGAPFYYDSLGTITDVTLNWRSYQPANVFCVKPDVTEYTPGGIGPTVTASNPACRHSGFSRKTKGLVVIRVRTPTLCPGCRRLFINFSKIPRRNDPPEYYYPHGHVFFRLASGNFTYTVDPLDHSPNTKNFTNDKLLAPTGSTQEQVIGAGDLHQFFGYVTDTAHFVHTEVQGPYYIGPWYVSRQGRRINGVYFDVDVADATKYGYPQANLISYVAGFNSGQSCPPGDSDSFYAGCVDWWGYSTSSVDPYAPLRSKKQDAGR